MERPVVMESKQTRKRRLARERQRRRRERLDAASNEHTLHRYYYKMMQLKFACQTSDKAILEAHKIVYEMLEDLVPLKEQGLLPQCGKAIFKHAKQMVPDVKTNVVQARTENEDPPQLSGLATIPKRILNSNNLIREVSYIPVKDLLAHITGIHGQDFFKSGVEAMLSVDGVPESHSGSTTLRVILYSNIH
jgi:hypothetical protein